MKRMKEIKIRNLETLKDVVKNMDHYIENDVMIEYYNEIGFRMKAKQLKNLIEEGVFNFNQ